MSERRIATAKNMAVRQRNYRRARDRALTRLAQAYPDDYKKLLEQEKVNDQNEGRHWIDIDGTTNHLGLRAVATANTKSRASNNGKDTSHNGGKA